MMKNSIDSYYEYIIKVLSVAKIGKLFSKDPYALENYDEIEKLSMEALNKFSSLNFSRPNYFSRDVYPTPNVSVRCAIFDEENRVLLVKEKSTQDYSLPGGWCDLYETPSESCARECYEEAGIEIENLELLGVSSRKPKTDDASSINYVPEYQLTFRATVKKFLKLDNIETDERKFFSLDNLPKLSLKIEKENWLRILDKASKHEIFFD